MEFCIVVLLMICSIKPANGLSNRPVWPHWRVALGGTVNSLTVCAGIGHFVTAITPDEASDQNPPGARAEFGALAPNCPELVKSIGCTTYSSKRGMRAATRPTAVP